jgi:thioredoxin 1
MGHGSKLPKQKIRKENNVFILRRKHKFMKYLYFSAPWCGPCRMLGPIMEKVGQKYTVEKINVDENEELSAQFGIRSVPTVILVDESNTELERTVGVKAEGDYYDIFEKHNA